MAVYLDSELAEKQCQCPRCVVEREAWVAYIAGKGVTNVA